LIIAVLFGLMYFLMIRPQRAKAQQQREMLTAVAPGDEILTVGGIYGIVIELEPDEDGGDLVVEIADGIHVRVARKALALVVKPEADDDEEDDEEEEVADDAVEAGAGAEAPAEIAELPERVEEVNAEEETVNPGTAEPPATPERS
jgi:preprotein translocase subunit YajC